MFKELGRHANRVGHRSVLIVGLVRNHLNMFFLSVHHTIPKDNFLDYVKLALLPDAFKALPCSNFSIKLHFVRTKNTVC